MKNFHIPKMFGAVTVGGRGQVVIPLYWQQFFL